MSIKQQAAKIADQINLATSVSGLFETNLDLAFADAFDLASENATEDTDGTWSVPVLRDVWVNARFGMSAVRNYRAAAKENQHPLHTRQWGLATELYATRAELALRQFAGQV